ncbi:hypothetical protein D9M68_468150 [compost metagenome]
MDKKVVTELIQNDCNPTTITDELIRILDGPGRTAMLNDYEILHDKMGTPGASERTAQLIIRALKEPATA